MENWKTLRWSRHIRICFPYHTSVDVCTPTLLYETNEVASACAPHSLINKNIKHFVGPDLGPNCQLLLSAADKVSRTAWCLRSKPPLLLLARGGLGFAHKTWLPSQKNFVRGRGGSNFDNVFLVDDGKEDPNTTKAGHHWPASETPLNWRFADWWPNMECWLGTCSFVILRGTGLVCLETLFLVIF